MQWKKTTLPTTLLLAGVLGWTGAVLAAVLTSSSYARFSGWMALSVIFLVAFILNARAASPRFAATGAQSVSVILMVLLLCNGYEGLLLVVVAAELALQAPSPVGLAWVVTQSVALGVAIAFHWSISAALLVGVPYFGFQVLVFAAVRLFVDERMVRERLDGTNRTLRQLQAELVDKSRIEERLRITQDLHDSLGHHLVALGLHLELAAQESQGSARNTVRTAQTMARAALREVKTIVSRQDEEAPVDLRREMDELANELLRPKVHVDCARDIAFDDPRIGRVLLRAVQEIVTNAIRHGEARNLWIEIQRSGDRVILSARDDGQGSTQVSEGFGLSGMRRRLEELGGTFSAMPLGNGGFEVRAEVPIPSASGT
jgi:signal transduction histidine kinase